MKNLARKIGKFIFTAIAGAILWTGFLTPYMFIVVRTTWEQWVNWVVMEFTLVPIVAPFVFYLTEIGLKKVKLTK
jgi:membrane protein DedA with SNARE-associated domain